jgi:hypothetical protein
VVSELQQQFEALLSGGAAPQDAQESDTDD